MVKRLAVAVIHGMGSAEKNDPANTAELTFSKELRNRIAGQFARDEFEDAITWREVFWSDILQKRQEKYLGKIKRRTRFGNVRKFILHNLSDAASYRLARGDDADTTYKDIHARVKKTVADLENDVAPGSPLVVLAYSLGGHIMSNYIYDVMKTPSLAPTNFQKLKTMGGLVTFGCNIPIFIFAYRSDKVVPIKFPGIDLPASKKMKPWWLNFYDKDDVLAYPLEGIGPKYEALVTNKSLKETPINAGGLTSSWNPLSHNAYWKDEDFYKPAARFLKKFL